MSCKQYLHVLQVGSGYVEPAAKKAKKDGGDKAECQSAVGSTRMNLG